jgi:hypothetical protein
MEILSELEHSRVEKRRGMGILPMFLHGLEARATLL